MLRAVLLLSALTAGLAACDMRRNPPGAFPAADPDPYFFPSGSGTNPEL